MLYGTTSTDLPGSGMVFKMNANGTGYKVLHKFQNTERPYAALVQGGDGFLYGTASSAETGFGAAFKLTTNGTGYTILHKSNGSDGKNPYAPLLFGHDGGLYGTTYSGGSGSGGGTVFKLNTDGTGFTVLHSFNSSVGRNPYAPLIQGNDGFLYGTTYAGTSTNRGTVFKLNTNGTAYTTIYSFNAELGKSPYAALGQGNDGMLYGTAYYTHGGICCNSGFGVVFKLDTNGNGNSVLHTFGLNAGDGRYPYAALVQDNAGTLYGTTRYGGTSDAGTVFKLNTESEVYALIYSFNASDGRYPRSTLIQGRDGALYGSTLDGGNGGNGVLFKVDTDGSAYSVLTATDGPSGLLQGRDGVLYATTYWAGYGYGTVFKIKTNGTGHQSLYLFSNPADGTSDGRNPNAAMIQATDEALYSVTIYGGFGKGTIFKVKTNGTGYAVIYRFNSYGQYPSAPLIQGFDGGLYGTASSVGGFCSQCEYGTVFRINTNGSTATVLHTFTHASGEGRTPKRGLLQAPDGRLYGTTADGGAENAGIVFRLNTNGADYIVLHSFSTNSFDGQHPSSELIQGNDGAFYGTTSSSGTYNSGTFYRIGPDGNGYMLLYSFWGSLGGGATPNSLHLGEDGDFYGLTTAGGDRNYGTIFKLSIPTAPQITKHPQNHTQVAGQSVTFSVSATGSEPLAYQWFFNDTNALMSSTGTTLTLPQVSRSNAGQYMAQVSNLLGSALSSNATLSVRIPYLLNAPSRLPNGGFQFTSTYFDGFSINPGDETNSEASVSSNLVDWVTLPSSLSISNGALIVTDTNASGFPVLFYRIIQY